MLKPGDEAPAFTLRDQHERPVSLSDFRGRKVLVFFYPKADTPGCTVQACGLRDVSGEIGDTVVLGISPDAPDAQKAFDAKFGLGFPLLADEEHAVAESYGAWGERSLYSRTYMGVIRSAFLVDEEGRLTEAWPGITPEDTPTKLLAALAVAPREPL
ncbi:MAG: thioredoxin-dependent thiol peroxidase [Thermoanaerobaculia bacterium]